MEFLLKFLVYVTFTLFIVFLIALFFLAIWFVIFTGIFIIAAIGFGIYFGLKKLLKYNKENESIWLLS